MKVARIELSHSVVRLNQGISLFRLIKRADHVGRIRAPSILTTIGLALAGILLLCASRVEAAWSRKFWGPTDGPVYALAVDKSGALYAGGDFVQAGKVMTWDNVAKWDGSNWSPIGSSVRVSHVRAIAVDGSGNVYAAPLNNRVVKWDGTSWSDLGQTDGLVRTITMAASGEVYAGGDFTTVGGVIARGIAKWDGNSWSALDSGVNDEAYQVYALATDGSGNVYAGGTFTTIGGVSAGRIAKWNGSSWSALGSGMDYPGYKDYTVHGIAVDGSGSIYAGGIFDTAGGVKARGIAKWDGSSWSALGSELAGDVSAIAVGPSGDVYAGGIFEIAGGVTASRIAKWDGTSWSALGSELDGGISTIAVGPSGDVYMGGYFTLTDHYTIMHAARWDGTRWRGIGWGNRHLSGPVHALDLDSSGNVYAAYRPFPVSKVSKWNGQKWSDVGPVFPYPSEIYAVAAGKSGGVYAGGDLVISGRARMAGMAKWDGTSWSRFGKGLEGDLYARWITAIAFGARGRVYAGGGFISDLGEAFLRGISRWTGSRWASLGSGMGDERVAEIRAVAVDVSGNVYAVGKFTTAGGVSANNIAKWDGNKWSALGSGLEGDLYTRHVSAIALDGRGNVYAGGSFHTAGGVEAHNIAKWNGTSWSALGSGLGGDVYALALDRRGNLYAGGTFESAGGVLARNIAKWDGSKWSPLRRGTDDSVYAIEADEKGGIYVGGRFTTVGGSIPSYHIGYWRD